MGPSSWRNLLSSAGEGKASVTFVVALLCSEVEYLQFTFLQRILPGLSRWKDALQF